MKGTTKRSELTCLASHTARSSGSRRAAAFKSKPTSSGAGVSPARGVFGSSSSFRVSPGHNSGTPRRRASDTAASGAGTAGAPRGSATPAANTTAGAGAASSRPAPASASAAAAAELKATAARYAAEVERLQSQVSSLKAREQALCTALDAEREAREAAQAQEAEAAQARAAVLEGLFRDVRCRLLLCVCCPPVVVCLLSACCCVETSSLTISAFLGLTTGNPT